MKSSESNNLLLFHILSVVGPLEMCKLLLTRNLIALCAILPILAESLCSELGIRNCLFSILVLPYLMAQQCVAIGQTKGVIRIYNIEFL